MVEKKKNKLILFGDSAFAEIAYEYFTYDSVYDVIAFTVDGDYMNKKSLFGKPVIPFEEVEEKFPTDEYVMHIALTYSKLNRIREQKYIQAKKKGYELVNYISSKAFVWQNVEMGDNVFIFEDNTIQPFVKIGSNNVFWSGNHIGHHSVIADHSFISSHVVISGFCEIGNNCFLGVNSTIGNNVRVGKDCLIGASATLVKSCGDGLLFKGTVTKPDEKSIYQKLGIESS